MKTEIIKIKGSWEDVVNRCRATVGKDELGKEPSRVFKRKILIAEHSPIREIHVSWAWRRIKSWVATHWVRHKWECYVETQRDDRTGNDRDNAIQAALVNFFGEANPQHTIDTERKRLCRQAHPQTREYAEDLKVSLWHYGEEEWSDALVPNCVYRCGCPEMTPCGGDGMSYWEWLVKKTNGGILTGDIQERYDLYNALFWEGRGR
jgi:hypothetical protein